MASCEQSGTSPLPSEGTLPFNSSVPDYLRTAEYSAVRIVWCRDYVAITLILRAAACVKPVSIPCACVFLVPRPRISTRLGPRLTGESMEPLRPSQLRSTVEGEIVFWIVYSLAQSVDWISRSTDVAVWAFKFIWAFKFNCNWGLAVLLEC